jgi:N-carbamoyl-L-amino-acid hydrolase
MIHINAKRFLNNLAQLARIGRLSAADGGGLDRRPFSAAERQARRFLVDFAGAAGLENYSDAAANLFVRLPAGPPHAQTILLGSHLDTVPNGATTMGRWE